MSASVHCSLSLLLHCLPPPPTWSGTPTVTVGLPPQPETAQFRQLLIDVPGDCLLSDSSCQLDSITHQIQSGMKILPTF